MSSGIKVLRILKNVLSLISLIATASFFVLFAVTYKNFPPGSVYYENFFGINIEFNKSSVFLIFIICAGLVGLLFIISRFSTLYKYPVKITADNIEIQYHLSKIILNALQICTAIFCWFSIAYIYIKAAKGMYMPAFSFTYTIPLVMLAIYISYRITAKAYK